MLWNISPALPHRVGLHLMNNLVTQKRKRTLSQDKISDE